MKTWFATLCCCFLVMGLIGCAALAPPPTVPITDELRYELTTADRGFGKTHRWTLPGKRSISRIEVQFDPEYPLKTCTVYAQVAEGNWKRIAEVKTPVKVPPFVIRTSVIADAIRITHASQLGEVTGISLYGPQ